MRYFRVSKPPTVHASGADAGLTLCGAARNNQGLRLVISQAQPRGRHGPITGPFVVLETGANRHADALSALLHRPTDAAEVLAAIRRRHPGCVHVVNTDILVLERDAPRGGART